MIIDRLGKIFDDRRKENKKVSVERRSEDQQQVNNANVDKKTDEQ